MSRRRRNDLGLYDRHAEGWWDPADRAFASLRGVNRFRLATLERWLGERLARARVVDVGCGGGLMAVPLARRGAAVVGIDLSHASLRSGQRQADPAAGPWFVRADAAAVPLQRGCADLVLLADLLEHVARPADVVGEAARLLRPGGYLFVNTINRTRRARLLAVCLGEGLGLIPRGTHDADLFVRPGELDRFTSAHGLLPVDRQGEAVALWPTLRRWAVAVRASRSLAVGYSALYRSEAC